MVHKSLPTWVDYVVNWLGSHGISATPSPAGSGSGARCAQAGGALTGVSLGPLKLGWTRARARRTLTHFVVTRYGMDNFCLAHGPGIRAGYPSSRLLRQLPAKRRPSIRARIIVALTANRHYALDGIRPNTRLAAVSRRILARKPFQIGRNTWYVIPGKRSTGLLKVQRHTVLEVGIADRQITRDRAAQRKFLTSFRHA